MQESKPRILVVDDDALVCSSLKRSLRDYDVETVQSGKQLFEKIDTDHPDLILLDVSLPEVDGYQICRQLRSDTRYKFTKIMFLSGNIGIEDRLSGYEAGADDYLMKPCNLEELNSKVRVMLRLKGVEELNQIKTDFLSLIGHETRTPLGIISGTCEILLDHEELDRQAVIQNLRRIEKSAERLIILAEKAMLACKLKAGHCLHVSTLSVEDLVKHTVKGFRDYAEQKDVTVTPRLEPMKLQGDTDLLAKALSYILENAIKYSSNGGEVLVTGESGDSSYTISISDKGTGMTPSALKNIFNLFAIDDVMHHSKGLGLTLALTKRILELHGGETKVSSELGLGTTVELKLPRQ